jgi:aminoglycoside phosphotransferase family enzyme
LATATAWDTRTSNRDGQAEVIAFLADSATHGGVPVACVETHISLVFLAGDDAYKLKRAVKYDYLDFSSAALRRRYCDAELRLNRRTAPDIYKAVLPITRSASGALEINGSGVPVDWVVHMARFDQSQLLDRLAAADALPLPVMDSFVR